MGKFQQVYKHIIKQQKALLKKNIIAEDVSWRESLQSLGNVFTSFGNGVKHLTQGEFEEVGKDLKKLIQAPAQPIVDIFSSTTTKNYIEIYEQIQKLDFEKNEFLKLAMAQCKEKYPDDKIIDEFTSWSTAGENFIEKLKKERKTDEEIKTIIRKIYAYKINEAGIAECEKLQKEGEDETQEEEDEFTKLTKEFKAIFLEIIPGKKAEDLFNKRLKENKVLIVKSTGKIGKYPLESIKGDKNKYLNFAKRVKDKAKAARAAKTK